MPDRAAVTLGGDVLRVGALAERHRDGRTLVGETMTLPHLPDRKGIASQNEVSDQFGGLAAALLGNPVVAHGRLDLFVAHEFFEHVWRGSGVGVALGVGVPERVGADFGSVERKRVAVLADDLRVEPR